MAATYNLKLQILSTPSRSSLAIAKKENQQNLCRALWDWDCCHSCLNNTDSCVGLICPGGRIRGLHRYFEHYQELVSSYSHDLEYRRDAAIRSHEDIFRIIQLLRKQPNISRRRLAEEVFGHGQASTEENADREHAIGLAVKLLTMVYSTHWLKQNAEHDNGDLESATWLDDIAFDAFVESRFPTTDHPGFGEDSSSSFWEFKSKITGTKLVKRGGLIFEPTEDLSNHLKLNRATGVVEMFHHTAFLKESLRITKGSGGPMSIKESLGLGAIPRQLALEVLDSMQKIIFPLSDPSAVALLQNLVSNKGFDRDCLRFESSVIREPHETNTQYIYFGARLADICDELENPTPRGFISRWAKREGAGHANIAAIVAVVLALLFGLITLGLGGFQAWVSWQQWKHPINN
ncbi:hypothetical protein TWF694_002010 [Orbilia ellipsospora]|uniref:Uncharacterized protein n=1 Tax=Orbilia ellipsospora TaxID=2528407 RepID=A0AAV9X5G2_9PEZI